MNSYDELDRAIDQLLANPESMPENGNPAVTELRQLACALRELPSPDFKSRLKTELDWVAAARPLSTRQQTANASAVLPSLFGMSYGTYPMRHINFVASLTLHATAMLLVAVLGVLAFKDTSVPVISHSGTFFTVSDYVPPKGIMLSHGGGSGGGADKIKQSKGNLPRTADYQFVPPTVTPKTQPSRLMVDATIIAPDLHVAENDHVGDPLSNLMTPSDGTGVKGGIGTNGSGGVGSGRGPGYGPGEGGNFGGSVFSLGNGVMAPKAIYDPEPEYSPEARAAHYQGTVLVWAIIDEQGIPRNPRVKRSLGMGLDEKAITAIRTWRFQPGTKDGHPVAVAIEVEVNFRLY